MNDELFELRYPFDSMLEFLVDGYWPLTEGLHLSVSLLFACCLCGFVLTRRHYSVAYRFTVLYFALALFTNPAFDVAGVKVNEICGLLAVTIIFVEFIFGLRPPKFTSPVAIALVSAFAIGFTHSLFVSLIYPVLNPDIATFAARAAINLKVLVLATNVAIAGRGFQCIRARDFMIKVVVLCGAFGLFIYVLQAFVLFFGTIPFGTYIDAGFIGIPTFGSVSIERGHFGKFMAPLLPFFLYGLLAHRWRIPFILLVVVSCVNFSASGQFFFVVFMVLAVLQFKMELARAMRPAFAAALLVAVVFFATMFGDVFMAVAEKIYTLAIEGDETTGGGRSFGVFLDYLGAFPLGIGYSGSLLRTAPGLPEMNAALFAFGAQYSLLAVPLFLGFSVLVLRTQRLAASRFGGNLLQRTMRIGVLLSVVIFATEILWFVPTIWLSFELMWAESRRLELQRSVSSVNHSSSEVGLHRKGSIPAF